MYFLVLKAHKQEYFQTEAPSLPLYSLNHVLLFTLCLCALAWIYDLYEHVISVKKLDDLDHAWGF